MLGFVTTGGHTVWGEELLRVIRIPKNAPKHTNPMNSEKKGTSQIVLTPWFCPVIYFKINK